MCKRQTKRAALRVDCNESIYWERLLGAESSILSISIIIGNMLIIIFNANLYSVGSILAILTILTV